MDFGSIDWFIFRVQKNKENRSFGLELNNDTLINLRKNKIVKNVIFTSSNDNNLATNNTYIPQANPVKKDLSNFEKNYIIRSHKNNDYGNLETINKVISKVTPNVTPKVTPEITQHKFVDLLEFNEDDFTIEQPKILSLNDNDLKNVIDFSSSQLFSILFSISNINL